jgi:hypothetical protein
MLRSGDCFTGSRGRLLPDVTMNFSVALLRRFIEAQSSFYLRSPILPLSLRGLRIRMLLSPSIEPLQALDTLLLLVTVMMTVHVFLECSQRRGNRNPTIPAQTECATKTLVAEVSG